LLAPLAVATWPAQAPSAGAWAAVLVLGVLCTGFAHLLFFRLIERVGAMRTANVTYLIPLFATLWGSLFLAEPLTLRMVAAAQSCSPAPRWLSRARPAAPAPLNRYWFLRCCHCTSAPPAKRFSTRASTNSRSDRRLTYCRGAALIARPHRA